MEIKMARELNIRLNTEIKTPLYRQIYAFIRDEIRSGSLEADERLPSTRSLAAGLHVARSTAELAYSQLLSEGYIRAKKNSGYFVNGIENLSGLNFETVGSDPDGSGTGIAAGAGVLQDTVPALTRLGKYVDSGQNSSMIDFSLRHTEMSVFPYSTWKRIMREVMVDANSEMFSHSEPGGDRSLRVTIAHYLHFSRGVRCIPEQVIVGAGNDYLLMLLRHILGENRKVAMENPSYQRAARIFLFSFMTPPTVQTSLQGMKEKGKICLTFLPFPSWRLPFPPPSAPLSPRRSYPPPSRRRSGRRT